MQNIKLSINGHCFFWEEYEESFFFSKKKSSPPFSSFPLPLKQLHQIRDHNRQSGEDQQT